MKTWLAACEAWMEPDYPRGPSRFVVVGIRSDGEPCSSMGEVSVLLSLRDPDVRVRAREEVWRHFNRQLLEEKK